MTAHDRDVTARLRYEAKVHRQQARRLSDLAIQARERHDPLAALQYSSGARERTMLAKVADQERQKLTAIDTLYYATVRDGAK